MSESNLVVGVDIGTTKICAAGAYLGEDGNLNIKGFVERSVAPEDEALHLGEIVNASKTIEILDEVLEQLAEDLNLNLATINLNISNPHIAGSIHKDKVTKSGDNKQIHQNDVENLVNSLRTSFKCKPGNVVLHSIPQDFYVNDIRVNEKIVGRFGVQIGGEFYFITSNTESINNLYYTVKNVNSKVIDKEADPIDIDNLLFSPIADSFALLRSDREDKRAGVAILNIGADISELAIFHKNGLRHVAVIPYAGNCITEDLSEAFGISFKDAELLKKICGTVPSANNKTNDVLVIEQNDDIPSVEILLKNATVVIEWRLKEIAALVKAEIIKSGYEGALTNGLIITGGTSMMPICKQIFSETCKIRSVRKGKLAEDVNINQFSKLSQPKYSTLIGLLKSSYNQLDARIDNNIVLKHANTGETKIETVPTPPKEVANTANSKVPEKEKKNPFNIFNKIKDYMSEDMNDEYKK